ncbi:hypothetical protein DUI87_10894 [Hirundo rustica rustica]|uniref:Uncharacterized protein n=1 Tax=Hirundo rustica rustica TaxID=333673 RepID=A0A3M0KJC4_HIRRU|nr:hypothetical protein DUI87_10894 [Hirundo rustica rustica]
MNCDEKEQEANAAGKEGNDPNVQRNLGSLLEERIQLPVLDLDKGCLLITDLMDKLTHIFGQGLPNCFYPVPRQANGVASTFEGWSLHAKDIVYRVLVLLSPPPGHAFHLELDTVGMLQRNFCVHVELLCTCRREQLGEEDMLCFLYHPKEELRRKQDPRFLHTLCTGAYLDVEKTVHWFYRFVRVAWLLLPQSRRWRSMLRPSSCSCKFQLSKDKESFVVEVIFGVQQGDSDVFVGSQPTEAGVPSTTWLETYAVAEAKFFSYALKTVVIHLLITVPLRRWRRRDFQQRLMDILKYLQPLLETKQPHQFVIGNERFPMEISLPSSFQVAEPLNIFQHLASSADTHTKAVQEYVCLLHGLKQLLTHGP